MLQEKERRKMRSEQRLDTEFSAVRLKQTQSAFKVTVNGGDGGIDGGDGGADTLQSRMDAVGRNGGDGLNKDSDGVVESGHRPAASSGDFETSSDEEDAKSLSVELSAEEVAALEAERVRRERELTATRTANELVYRGVLHSKLVMESVELCKRTGERLNWVLFTPNRSGTARKSKRGGAKRASSKRADSKFERKLRRFEGVRDLRERSFLMMADENKMADAEAMRLYIEHFGGRKVAPKDVAPFFESMRPNINGMLTFSKFVRAIDSDGDVVAAFDRFQKYGSSRSQK